MSKTDYNKFIEYCQNGNLDMAKLLLSAKPDIDISAHNEWAFRISCIYGHLEVAKWLLSLKPDIDISAGYEGAFRSSCEKGHLEVAKWLFSIKPNIDMTNKQKVALISLNVYLKCKYWQSQSVRYHSEPYLH